MGDPDILPPYDWSDYNATYFNDYIRPRIKYKLRVGRPLDPHEMAQWNFHRSAVYAGYDRERAQAKTKNKNYIKKRLMYKKMQWPKSVYSNKSKVTGKYRSNWSVGKKRWRPPSWKSKCNYAYRQVKKMKSMKEKKYCDLNATDVITTTPNIVNLFQAAQGPEKDERIGDNVSVESLAMNFKIVPNTSRTSSAELVRVVILIEQQPNGALPAWTDFFNFGS